MALRMLLGWGAADSTELLNTRFKGVFSKGFATGAEVTPSVSTLQVTVSPFVLVTSDGAVVTEDQPTTLTVGTGVKTYIVVRARYRQLNTPILTMQALSAAAFSGDPEAAWLHVVATVDLTVGGPHTFPPASSISTLERNTIDPVSRSPWRAPVATLGALPTVNNRHGDVRLVTDTGSFHWWNDVGSIWEIFDEVPLTHHRGSEHTNGMIARSASTALQPGVTGTDITIGAVPAESGYTVAGRFVASPASDVSFAASTVGSSRGLLQVAYDENGVRVSSYRVQRDVDALDLGMARILGVSDGHPNGTFSLFFDPTLGWSWAGGVPVQIADINTRTRLFNVTGLAWVDIVRTGAEPAISASDNYIVTSSLKDADHYLVGHWFWDGSTTLVLGEDKRVIGTVGPTNLSTDFQSQLDTRTVDDLRGNGVVSGGEMVILTGTLQARVVGPIIAMVAGKRFAVAGNYSGVSFPASATRYLVVDASGQLVQLTGLPTTPHALIAQVDTNGSQITSVTDMRASFLLAGKHAGVVRVGMGDGITALVSKTLAGKRVFSTEGALGDEEDTVLRSGVLHSVENVVESPSHLSIVNTSTGGVNRVSNASAPLIAAVLPGATAPSLVEAAVSAADVSKFGVGFATTADCAPTAVGLNLTLAAGTIYTFAGKRAVTTGAVIDTSVVDIGDSGVVFYNSATNAFVISELGGVPTAVPIWRQDIPVAVFVRNASNITSLLDVRPIANGARLIDHVTVGGDEANFRSLRSAVGFLSCYNISGSTLVPVAPSRVVVTRRVNADQETVKFGDFYSKRNFEQFTIEGDRRYNSDTAFFWGQSGTATTTPLLDLSGKVDLIRVKNVDFVYAGDSTTVDGNCWVKDALLFDYEDVNVNVLDSSTGIGLRHIQWWSLASGFTTPDPDRVSKISRCNFRAVSGSPSPFHYTAALTTRIAIEDSVMSVYSYAFESAANSVFKATAAVNLDITVSNSTLEADTTWFDFTASGVVNVDITGGKLKVWDTTSTIATASSVTVSIDNAKVVGSSAHGLTMGRVFRCYGLTSNGPTVTGATTTRFLNCDLLTAGGFNGSFVGMQFCRMRVTSGFSPLAFDDSYIDSCMIKKEGGGTILSAVQSLCRVNNSTFTYTGTIVDVPASPAFSVMGTLQMGSCTVSMASRTSAVFGVQDGFPNTSLSVSGGSITTTGGPVTTVAAANTAPSDLERDFTGVSFDGVRFDIAHIPDTGAEEVPAFGCGVQGTASVQTLEFISFYKMRNCDITLDTPLPMAIYQTSRVDIQGNEFRFRTTNNVNTALGTARTKFIIGDSLTLSTDVGVESAFARRAMFKGNKITGVRKDNAGLTKLEVLISRFHTIEVDDCTMLQNSIGTVVDSEDRVVNLSIIPHFQRDGGADYSSDVSVNANRIICYTDVGGQTNNQNVVLHVQSGLGPTLITSGSLRVTGNRLIAQCAGAAGTGVQGYSFTLASARAAVALVDNNACYASPDASGTVFIVPSDAGTTAGTANIARTNIALQTISGTFIQGNNTTT